MRPTLVLNPSDDDAFREHALLTLAEWMTPEEFEARLRARYPRAAVHVRLLTSEPQTVWYVYREGRWVPSRPSSEE